MSKPYPFFRTIWPSREFITDRNMFFHHDGFCFYNEEDQCLFVGARTYVSLDSYFNALSIIKYKHYTTIADLTMLVQVSGRGVARLCHTSANRVNFILSEKNFSGINQVIKFPVTQWQELQDGLLFLEIVALDDCKVHDCHFVTNTVSC